MVVGYHHFRKHLNTELKHHSSHWTGGPFDPSQLQFGKFGPLGSGVFMKPIGQSFGMTGGEPWMCRKTDPPRLFLDED